MRRSVCVFYLTVRPCSFAHQTMTSTESVVEQPCAGLEPLKNKNTHLPGKTTPSGGSGCGVFVDSGGPKVTVNGVHDIEDRILRITGYYGYNPGYSSHRREDGLESHAETPGSEASGESRSYQTCTSTVLKVLAGLLMVLCVSSSWVGTTQVVKLTFQSFSCPFFISWFSSNWNILFFPIYYFGHVLMTREKQTPIQKFRECSKLFGEEGMTLKLFVKRTAPFSILWTLTNYLYLLALKKLTATDVSALYCCHKAFVFLLSWIVLKDRFMGVRIVAAIMAITGIVMMAYADGFRGDSFVGVALAVGSASTSALYKVLFKMFLGSASLGEVAHFLSTMGFFNLIFISCVPLILYFTKVEQWGSLSSLPWGYLCGLAGLWLVFNILVHVGVVLTYPILISIGTLLSVPGNAAVDVLKHEVIFSVVRLAATCVICLGFLLLLLPEEWDSVTLRFLATIADKKSEEHGEELTESSVHTRSRSRANGAVSLPLGTPL
ncbi:solute carrier family 35 member F4 isoform X1 [Dunckerocampus dactyliophorus]|uniref:solute carrier family 35 member F4 isoform X1 n=3 Tax=Dunckerocampus dactyliophorus TaxID=161453 RepID=UPI0024056776|nr:solute carrier family 35 member F4 isoform X1 [Dunckerocampus dactyliophorus]